MLSKKSMFSIRPPLWRFGASGHYQLEHSRERCARLNGRRPECQGFKVLHDSGEMELVARTGKTSEPHAFEAVMNLQMGKAHLDALALVTRLEEGLRPHQAAR